MNSDVKAKWIAALRSGEYAQAQGILRSTDDTFCCLGVLCEVAVAEGVLPPAEKSRSGYWRYGSSTCNPPRLMARDWAGFSDEEMFDVRGPNEHHGDEPSYGAAVESLMHLNDVRGMSFDEIADWIEANL